MPVLNEKKIDLAVVKWFKHEYPQGVCIKLALVGAHGTAGWPDRLFMADGRAAFVELKAPKKKPTPLQEARMDQLRMAGAQVGWFDNAEAAIEFIDAVLHGDRP
jgi:hypothetical protein